MLPSKASRDAWLADTDNLKSYIQQEAKAPHGADNLVWHEVDPAMGSPKVQGPRCCQPIKRPSAASFFAPRHSAGAVAGACAKSVAVKDDPAATKLEHSGSDEPVAQSQATEGVHYSLQLLIPCATPTQSN